MKHFGTVPLQSERLFLRRVEIKDAEELYNGYLNQDEFLYYAGKEKKTLDDVVAMLNAKSEKYKNDNYYDWVITLKETEAIIGAINLRVDNENDSVEFNYAIDNRYVNKGYMTEALNLVKTFALDVMKVKKFQGGCCVENVASKKVMEKCEMHYDGIVEKHIELRDGKHDMYLFSITNS